MNHLLRKIKGCGIARVLGSAAFLLLLVGCSYGTSSNPPASVSASSGVTATSTLPRPTPTPTTGTSDALFAQNPSDQITVDGLTINPQGEALGCGTTVLTSNRLTYSGDELQQLINYFSPAPHRSLPATLTDVQGSFVNDITSWGMIQSGCTGYWEVTNTTQKPVQIAQINMQLTGDPQPDTYQYRFLDLCSLPFPPSVKNPCIGHGGGTLGINYTLNIGPASASTVFQSQVAYAEPVLDPGQTEEVGLHLLPADSTSSFFYTLTPELVLNTVTGNGQVVNLTQLTSTVALVSDSQLACYQFHGQTLSPVTPVVNGPVVTSVWCM